MLSAYTGTSDGGMVAQVYVQKYPGETGGLVLISTGGLDANTIKSLKRQYFFAPLALWYLKHCSYEKLKPKLIRLGMSHLRGEGPEEAAYAQDMFETIFRGYRQEKDDYFSEKMQRDLIRLMHEPRIAYVSGGHLTTVLQAEKFIETIRAFLPSLGSNADRREWQGSTSSTTTALRRRRIRPGRAAALRRRTETARSTAIRGWTA